MMRKTENFKGDNSGIDLENFTKKNNQVVHALDTIYDPNIMTLAYVVLEIFCSQSENRKKEIIQSWIQRKR